MANFLGEKDVTNFCDLTRDDFIFQIISYGQIDGAHHKQWALDQIARIMLDAPVTVKEASWDNGKTELRISVGTCDKYENWVKEYKAGEYGPNTYSYDEGIAP